MRLRLTALTLCFAALLSAGCPGVTAKDISDLIDTGDGPGDADGDGFSADEDCDDDNADVNPDAEELCDGIDNNCDDVIDTDATDLATFYADGDGDTYGNNDDSVGACADAVPTGYVADNTDCDDAAADVNPAADEVCNDIDDNCDGAIDEDTAIDASSWFADTDADTYGDPAVEVAACTQPSGYVADNTDCDDTLADVNTDGTEVCDGIDNDCDDTVDEDDATDALTWYADGDADSYGDAAATTLACNAPSGYVADATDCDDAAAAVNPAATEYCDTIDNDCDGTIDEDDAADAGTFYVDGDGDGFGDASSAVTTCYASSGIIADSTDCDDNTATTYPGADEYCNGVDDDCDNTTDEADAIDATAWYDDSDQDGYGDPAQTPVTACYANGFYSSDNADDCNDSVATTYPGADEYCNSVDDDCDGTTDEDDALDATGWTVDVDGDGYGTGTATTQCSAPTEPADTVTSLAGNPGGAVINSSSPDTVTDTVTSAIGGCLITDVTVDVDISHTYRADLEIDLTAPSGTSIMLWYDRGVATDDLVGTFTDGATNPLADDTTGPLGDILPDEALAAFAGEDPDGDWILSVRDDASVDSGTFDAWTLNISCDAGTYVADDNDCDDSDSEINPGATEICDGIDNDCDGSEPTDQVDWYDTSGTWSDGTANWTGGTASSPLAVTASEGTAVFCVGTYYVEIVAGNDLDLVGSTSDAADVVLDGGGNDRVVDVTNGADLNLVNLTVSNGYASEGANVRCDSSGSTVYTDNAVISGGSHSSGYGGGVYAKACDLDLENTQITGNSAMYGGGIYIKNADLYIVDSIIDNNTASLNGGGIRYISDSTGSTAWSEIHDTWVTNNTATNGGGMAIYADADIYVDAECTSRGSGGFLSNTATKGGAVYLDTSSGTDIADFDVPSGNDCDFGEAGSADDNTAEDVYIDGLSESHWFGNYTSFYCDDNGYNDGCVLNAPEEASWGSTATSGSTSGYIRGNVILSDGSTIDDFSMYLNPTGDLDFYVVSSPNGTSWTTEFASTVTGGNGEGWYNSGYIGLDTTNGDYYAVLVGWESSTDYYFVGGSGWDPGMGSISGYAQQNGGYTGGSGVSGVTFNMTNSWYYYQSISYR
jgi:subtilisin-like proprotein convertase family protein